MKGLNSTRRLRSDDGPPCLATAPCLIQGRHFLRFGLRSEVRVASSRLAVHKPYTFERLTQLSLMCLT